MKLVLLKLVLVVSSSMFSINHSENVGGSQEVGLSEEFILKGFNCGVRIQLRPDFTFTNVSSISGCTGGFSIKTVVGTYSINDNRISFAPEKLLWEIDSFNFYGDSQFKFDTIPYYESDSNSIQKNYWLIAHKESKFLVSETPYNMLDEFFYHSSSFIVFANWYNSKKANTNCKVLLSNNCSYSDVNDLDISVLPEDYQELFLKKPIEVKVIHEEINKIDNTQKVICLIDEKDKHLLKLGMELQESNSENFSFTLIEISDGICVAERRYWHKSFQKLKRHTILKTAWLD